ncbi:hypothetical protein LguiB_035851 [Lonicera macranthoides]
MSEKELKNELKSVVNSVWRTGMQNTQYRSARVNFPKNLVPDRIRGTDYSFEWYADWPQLCHPLLSHFSTDKPPDSSSSAAAGEAEASSTAQILVPGCGNSRLSEHLYDTGFRDITNIDFSKVVISEMLGRNVRLRPGMRWRVMDMTTRQARGIVLTEPQHQPLQSVAPTHITSKTNPLKSPSAYTPEPEVTHGASTKPQDMFIVPSPEDSNASIEAWFSENLAKSIKEPYNLNYVTFLRNMCALNNVNYDSVPEHVKFDRDPWQKAPWEICGTLFEHLFNYAMSHRMNFGELSSDSEAYVDMSTDTEEEDDPNEGNFAQELAELANTSNDDDEPGMLFQDEPDSPYSTPGNTAGMNRSSVFRKLRQDKGLAKQKDREEQLNRILGWESPDNMLTRGLEILTSLFVDGMFDAAVDKGGLDALMEPVQSLLFPKFRYWWIVSLHDIPQKPSKKPSLQTFMVVAKKDSSIVMHQVSSSFTQTTIDCSGDQARGLFEALDIENRIRTEHTSGSDLLYSLEDLQLGAGGDLTELSPGRRLLLTLGEPGSSRFFYKAVLLDALQQSSSFFYSCGVFLVPKVLLDTSQSNATMDDIQVSSALTGPIIVDDVVYEKVDGDLVSLFPSKELVFRRLTFRRSEGLGQSEALLTREGCQNVASGKEQKTHSSSKSSKKKGNQTRNDSLVFVTNGKDYSFLCSFSSDVHAYLFFGFLVVIIYE